MIEMKQKRHAKILPLNRNYMLSFRRLRMGGDATHPLCLFHFLFYSPFIPFSFLVYKVKYKESQHDPLD